MAHTPALSLHSARAAERKSIRRNILIRSALLAGVALLMLSAPLLFAQSGPHVATVDPASGKVNDTITVSGENLEKSHVSGVFLSDKKTDYRATVVEQSAEKIVMKVPQVAPGDYNVSIQTGNTIFIQPVRFTVEQ
jgi:hypothetical protein